MADIINLNRARKAKARTADAKRAEENRIRFGRTKAEKLANRAEEQRAARRHDGQKLDPPDEHK